ncbi:MAG: hypothetical protein ACOC25_09770 [Alkalispirochaetaceae bacterium]
MYQIYFLSILVNLLAGITLSFDRMDERLQLRSLFNPELFQHAGFRLTMAIITFVVGFLKLLSVSPGDVPVVGDLLPALAGMVMGFTLFLQYYKDRTTVESSSLTSLDRIFGNNSAIIGTLGIIVAILHFFLHRVLFL